jgi:hypothetical protein
VNFGCGPSPYPGVFISTEAQPFCWLGCHCPALPFVSANILSPLLGSTECGMVSARLSHLLVVRSMASTLRTHSSICRVGR